MRVLVCGSRNYDDFQKMWNELNTLHRDFNITLIIEGGAPGADTLAAQWGILAKIPVKEMMANWKKYGKAAGPIRNKRMLDEGKPDLVVAFPKRKLADTKGTKNMVEQARAAGVTVIVIEE